MRLRLLMVSGGVACLVLGGGWVLGGAGLVPQRSPDRVQAVNVGGYSVGISFATRQPTKSCVVVVGWPLTLKGGCEKGGRRVTHLIEVKDLQPERTYLALVETEGRLAWFKTVRVETEAVEEQVPLPPDPGYGSVVDPEGNPVVGALVVIYPVSEKFYYPVATLTNIEGNYAVDISPLARLSDRLRIEAVSTQGIWADLSVDSSVYSPFPPITVRTD